MKRILAAMTVPIAVFAFVATGMAQTGMKTEPKANVEAKAEPKAKAGAEAKAPAKSVWDTKCAKCHKETDKKKSKAALLEKYRTGDELIKAIKESEVPAKVKIKKDEKLLTALTEELYPVKKEEKKGTEKAPKERAKAPTKKKVEGC